MKKKVYFIKNIATATPDNKSFAGDVRMYIYGRKEELVAYKVIKKMTDCVDPVNTEFDNTKKKKCANNYGYTSAEIAKNVCKVLSAYKDTYNGVEVWKNHYSVIEVEV